MLNYSSKIPGHPATCKGVKSAEYDITQCRLCWLATYDKSYRRKWGITQKVASPTITVEQEYPCIHRGTERLTIPGCSTCSGTPLGYACNNQNATASRCLVAGQPGAEANARSKGLLVCRECGWREPEPSLEMRVAEFRMKLELNQLPDGWWDWQVARYGMLDILRDTVRSLPSLPQKNQAGRGIVTAAGGNKYFRLAFAQLYVLRKLGCTLPFQLWYLGEAEMDRTMLAICEDYGIETIDALEFSKKLVKKPRRMGGWELKPFATYHSRFEEVLFLDADCIPVRDPAYLFEDPIYQDLGSVFWPDIPGSSYGVREDVWKRIGRNESSFVGFESGQYLINKSRCWKELALTCWFNDFSDYWYKFVYGDKDTFCLAWHALDTDYGYAPPSGYKFPCILQYDNAGQLEFTHACQGKVPICDGLVDENSGIAHYNWVNEAAKILNDKVRTLTKLGGESTILSQGINQCRVRKRKN